MQAQGLTIRAGKDFELIDINDNPHFEESWKEYYQLRKRKGVTEEMARRRGANSTLIGALMVRLPCRWFIVRHDGTFLRPLRYF